MIVFKWPGAGAYLKYPAELACMLEADGDPHPCAAAAAGVLTRISCVGVGTPPPGGSYASAAGAGSCPSQCWDAACGLTWACRGAPLSALCRSSRHARCI